MAKGISFFNSVTIHGYVVSFSIKTGAKYKLANIGIEDTLTRNRTYATLFEGRNGVNYGGNQTTLEGLEKIFMGSDGTPRHVLVEAKGKVSETKGVNKTGQETIYVNTTIFTISPFYNEQDQYASLILTGVIDGIKYGEDAQGNPTAKLKVGVLRTDRDGNYTGCDQVTLNAYDDVVEDLQDKGAERGCAINLGADLVNSLGEVDRYGDVISTGKREIKVAKVKKVTDSYEIEDFVNDVYKRAKKLKQGEVIEVGKKSKTEKDVPKPKKAPVDDISDDELDW